MSKSCQLVFSLLFENSRAQNSCVKRTRFTVRVSIFMSFTALTKKASIEDDEEKKI
jgi:hypothetical protein